MNLPVFLIFRFEVQNHNIHLQNEIDPGPGSPGPDCKELSAQCPAASVTLEKLVSNCFEAADWQSNKQSIWQSCMPPTPSAMSPANGAAVQVGLDQRVSFTLPSYLV